jgi:AraC family transcriptional regulator of arabinose operon
MYIYSQGTRRLLGEAGRRANGALGTIWMSGAMSRSHVPSATARQVFNVVLRSGHFRFQPGAELDRRAPGSHEFFYCLNGSGYVLSERKQFRVNPFDLAWLSGPRAHWADRPREVLWMRVDGDQVRQAWEALSVSERPVFAGLPPEETRRVFHRVNELVGGGCCRDAALNRELAELLGYLVESRVAGKVAGSRDPGDDLSAISLAVEQMLGNLKRSWRAGELAKLCGLSERHFFRQFKQETGLSPIDWLRRERIRLAQAKLLDAAKRVKEVCDEVGYHDVFFFSRDFKRQTGSSPSDYRRENLSHDLSAMRPGEGANIWESKDGRI